VKNDFGSELRVQGPEWSGRAIEKRTYSQTLGYYTNQDKTTFFQILWKSLITNQMSTTSQNKP
jgi:hypothetical protein